MIHPPGTILQFMHLKERIKHVKPGVFLEIGCGAGYLSQILLNYGWKGEGPDLNSSALDANRKANSDFIKRGVYNLRNSNFFSGPSARRKKYDLIISSMVIEHFDENSEREYFLKCKSLLRTNGLLILFVPASPRHWGIEDDIAGHFRRYTRVRLSELAHAFHLKINCIDGLTYPVSNFLLPLSNYIVKIQEEKNLSLTNEEKTIKSGYRVVKGKTQFSKNFFIILNEYTLFPLYLIQKIFKNNRACLVLYAELTN